MSPSVFIGYVHPLMIPHPFHVALVEQGEVGNCVVAAEFSGPMIAGPRNKLLARFLETNLPWFLMVDTDSIWTPRDLERLLKHKVDAVTAVVASIAPNGNGIYPASYLTKKDNRYQHSTWVKGRRLTEVAAIGMGFSLLSRRLVESVGVGPLWPFAETLSPDGQPIGEDTTFSLRAQAKGFKLYVDPTVRVGHLKSNII